MNQHKYTTEDLVNAVYNVLNGNITITGDVVKYMRLINSKKEDIVINSIDLTNGKIQNGTVNVLIHVPDLSRTVDGQKQYRSDYDRIGVLKKAVISFLDGKKIGDNNLGYWFVDSASDFGTYQETDIYQSYSYIRCELKQYMVVV